VPRHESKRPDHRDVGPELVIRNGACRICNQYDVAGQVARGTGAMSEYSGT